MLSRSLEEETQSAHIQHSVSEKDMFFNVNEGDNMGAKI